MDIVLTGRHCRSIYIYDRAVHVCATRFQNGHFSTINIFVDNSRMQSYEIFPLSNALSDHKPQCIIFNKFFSRNQS